MRRGTRIAAGALALVFILEGALKFLPSTAAMFRVWGYPGWFAYAVGALELVGALLLFFRRTLVPAALALAAVMAGAFFTLLRAGEPLLAVMPFSLLVYCVLVAYSAHLIGFRNSKT